VAWATSRCSLAARCDPKRGDQCPVSRARPRRQSPKFHAIGISRRHRRRRRRRHPPRAFTIPRVWSPSAVPRRPRHLSLARDPTLVLPWVAVTHALTHTHTRSGRRENFCSGRSREFLRRATGSADRPTDRTRNSNECAKYSPTTNSTRVGRDTRVTRKISASRAVGEKVAEQAHTNPQKNSATRRRPTSADIDRCARRQPPPFPPPPRVGARNFCARGRSLRTCAVVCVCVCVCRDRLRHSGKFATCSVAPPRRSGRCGGKLLAATRCARWARDVHLSTAATTVSRTRAHSPPAGLLRPWGCSARGAAPPGGCSARGLLRWLAGRRT
jgi:hypothetical protein